MTNSRSSPSRRRLGRRVFRSLAVAFALCAVALGSVFYLWKEGRLQTWLKTQALKAHLNHLQPLLPFVVEDIRVETRLKDLLEGELSSVALRLRRDGWRLHLSGPMEITTGKFLQPEKIEYRPDIILEPVSAGPDARADALPAVLTVSFSENGASLRHLGFSASTDRWSWPYLGISLSAPDLVAQWSGASGSVHFNATEARLHRETGPDFLAEAPSLRLIHDGAEASADLASALLSVTSGENAAQVESLSLKGSLPLKLNPFSAGPEARARLVLGAAEALWNDRYHQAAHLGEVPLDVAIGGIGTGTPSEVRLRSPLFQVVAHSERLDGGRTRVRLGWKTPRLALAELHSKWFSAAGIESAPRIEDLRGRARTEGRLSVTLPLPSGGFDPDELRGELLLEDFGVTLPDSMIRAEGLSLKIPFDWNEPREGWISASHLRYRRAVWTIEKSPLLLSRDSLRATYGISLNSRALPIEIRPLHLRWGRDSGGEPVPFRLKAGLSIRELPLSGVARSMCADSKLLPPSTLEANIPEITLTLHEGRDSWKADGWVKVALFDGVAVLVPKAAEDLIGGRAYLAFDAEWGGIRLAELGRWLNFGRMDGIFQGHARGVEVQSGYPLNFDFRTELKPLNQSDIVFSPPAMKNLVGLIAEEQLGDIPGILQWFYFGFPRAVTGGYDLWYAGVSLHAQQGTIVLDTHDRENPEHYAFCQDKNSPNKHFIVCGQSFKMPVIHNRYPVVMDAVGLAHMVRGMAEYLGNLKDSGENEKEQLDADDEGADCFQ